MLTAAILAFHLLSYSWLAQAAVTAAVPGITAGPGNVANSVDAADSAYTQQQWGLAESQYKQLTEHDPSNARYWYRLGVSARAGKHYALALNAFQQAKLRGAGKGLPSALADYELSSTYAASGDAPHAFEALKVSVDEGFSQPGRVENDAEWKLLRRDPQFATLLRRVQKNARPCDEPEFHQFDFWLGDWDVFSASGAPQQGVSHIAAEMGGCVIWENWTSASSGYFGKSYNTYNVNLRRWEQYWVDNAAGVIFFHGSIQDGAMDYWTDEITQPSGQKLQRHLQFLPLSTGKVRQFSRASTDGGKTWTTEYDFLYIQHVPKVRR